MYFERVVIYVTLCVCWREYALVYMYEYVVCVCLCVFICMCVMGESTINVCERKGVKIISFAGQF